MSERSQHSPDGSTRPGRARSLAVAARRLDDEARERFLDDTCRDDAALRAKVEALLVEDDATRPQVDRRASPRRAAAKMPPRLGPYRIEHEIGRGAMGIVFQAIDTRLDRRVAIKTLHADLTDDPAALHGLKDEARALASVSHPNVATLLALEEHAGRIYLVMELVPGQSLRDRLDRGVMPVRDALRACSQVAAGLEAAHLCGVVHRDVKPANVRMLSGGLVKVVDFGLALRRAPRAPRLEDEHATAGTPGYMSPEQIAGRSVDARSDTWAFGCLLHACLTGTTPFAASTFDETVAKTLAGEIDLAGLPASVPPRVRALVAKCLSRELAERPVDMGRIRLEIDEALDEMTWHARRPDVAALRGNLAVPLTSHVGREREIADTLALVESARLVTLTGAGGCGKTRLALEAARPAASRFQGGAWLVELARVVDPRLVADEVARTLRVADRAATPIESLVGLLRQAPTLLVLDNCEHLLDSVATLASTLLREAPGLVILATSREPLGIAGERAVRVTSLSLPPEDLPPLEAAASSEAVQLFVERARLVRPELELDEDAARGACEIARRLDGIPLAIELAAARLNVLSIGQVVSRLGDAFRLLTGGSRTALPRQQALRATIDWSHDLLGSEERAAFRRLAVFVGGCDVEEAEATCAGGELPASDVLAVIGRLVNKSLVVSTERAGRVRFHLLETVRQYAREKLQESGESSDARSRHAEAFLALAERSSHELTGRHQPEWLDRVEPDLENVRAAIAWWRDDPAGAERHVRLVVAMHRHWDARGHWREGRREAVAALDHVEGVTVTTVIHLLLNAGWLDAHCGDTASGRARLERALELARAAGSRRFEAAAINHLGVVMGLAGKDDPSEPRFRQALAMAEAEGDERLAGFALINLGDLERRRGNAAEAQTFFERSLAIFRRLGDVRSQGRILLNLGAVAYVAGQDGEALTREALDLFAKLGDRNGRAKCLSNLGAFLMMGERFDEAREVLVESLRLKEELGDRHGRASTLLNFAAACRALGDLEAAAPALRESFSLREEAGGSIVLALGVEGLAQLRLAQGDAREAAVLVGAADSLRGDASRPPHETLDREHLVAGILERLDRATLEAALAEGASLDASALRERALA